MFVLLDHPEETIRINAALSLGGMSLRLRAQNSAARDRIDRWLLDQLRSAKGEAEVRQALRAIGNAGLEHDMPALKPYLVHESPSLRSLAVWALRWNRTALAEQILCGAMTTDPDPSVREKALEAFELRPMTESSGTAHRTVAQSDPSAPLRLLASRNLFRMRFRTPSVLTFIAQRAKDDADEENRKRLLELLDQN